MAKIRQGTFFKAFLHQASGFRGIISIVILTDILIKFFLKIQKSVLHLTNELKPLILLTKIVSDLCKTYVFHLTIQVYQRFFKIGQHMIFPTRAREMLFFLLAISFQKDYRGFYENS